MAVFVFHWLVLLLAHDCFGDSRYLSLPNASCKNWCNAGNQTWEKKCRKQNCGGCAQCQLSANFSKNATVNPPTTSQLCQRWCNTSDQIWKKKCSKKDECGGCAQCQPTNSPRCRRWCLAHDEPWTTKCTWKSKCSGCLQCHATTVIRKAQTTALPSSKDGHGNFKPFVPILLGAALCFLFLALVRCWRVAVLASDAHSQHSDNHVFDPESQLDDETIKPRPHDGCSTVGESQTPLGHAYQVPCTSEPQEEPASQNR